MGGSRSRVNFTAVDGLTVWLWLRWRKGEGEYIQPYIHYLIAIQFS